MHGVIGTKHFRRRYSRTSQQQSTSGIATAQADLPFASHADRVRRSTQFSIALLLCGIVSSVLFGVAATAVLSIPGLSVHAAALLPIVVVASWPCSCLCEPVVRRRFESPRSLRCRLSSALCELSAKLTQDPPVHAAGREAVVRWLH
jgi:hypothetical protein